MQLKKIHLAGFKSFVDPTTLEFRGNLVGIVGPNGCGKSNIIDAVRWVMGESSAKQLRGESMADVIFNGSTGRKPVGKASIELVFDNTAGKLGGEYSKYAEISIRREVTREGKSDYFLNSTRCRRKDITDIFLGTGLGPRSYAIIEQGTISRVIEAKPEDLRLFIEEAANISIYKRRRHETDLRMRHTKENLERLEDIRQEQTKLVEKLKKQSEDAAKYKELKSRQELLEAELSVLRWSNFNSQLEESSLKVKTLGTKLEEKLSRRASSDLDLEKFRLENQEKSDIANQVQKRFYDLGANIARVEQTLAHQQDRKRQLELDLQDINTTVSNTLSQISIDSEKLEQLNIEFEDIEPNYQENLEKAYEVSLILEEAQAAMLDFEERFESYQESANEPHKQAEVEKAKIEQLERQSRDIGLRIERLEVERNGLMPEEIAKELEQIEEKLAVVEEASQRFSDELSNVSSKISQKRNDIREKSSVINTCRVELQTLKGRQASLLALQQAALNKSDESIKEWLEKTNFIDSPRLAEKLKVESGYEQALETVLGTTLEAVCVDSFDKVFANINDFVSGNINFIQSSSTSIGESSQINLPTLASKVVEDGNTAIPATLSSIYVAQTLDEALLSRDNLMPHQSIVTKDGIWFGQNWLRVHKGDSSHSGVLSRENEIAQIVVRIDELEQKIEVLDNEIQESSELMTELELKQADLNKERSTNDSTLRQLSNDVSSKKTKLDHTRVRLKRIETELSENRAQVETFDVSICESRALLEEALEKMAELSELKEKLLNERTILKESLTNATLEAKHADSKKHELELKRQTILTQKEGLEMGVARLKEQYEAAASRKEQVSLSLDEFSNPDQEIKLELERLLESRLKVEGELSIARNAVDEIDEKLRDLEKSRNTIEHEANVVREELNEAKMNWQALDVRCKTMEEQIIEAGYKLQEIRENLSSDADENEWQEELDKINTKIVRLGAINLAAIEEYDIESERAQYLDMQFLDLNEALETLENAIRKIDKETRQKFKETFQTVNENFKVLFPKLFGGGQAYLDLSGDDLLEAGVTVMARPPGKKNSSIHLLSGGEKALTAVSLVFAIFQLNPAPFCMLDEVDAPLDDANVGRFCNLVRHMAETVQFVYISHNKITIEMANQLAGVTMKEPGVSRLVSVDVEEAAKMAEA